MRRPYQLLRFWLLACLIASPSMALADQDAEQPALPGEEPTAEVVTGDGEVGVDDAPSDRRIERRLREILEATGRYESLSVESRDGVVFLDGVVSSEDDRALAADLAKRTDGVAAAINNLTLPERPIWTLRPAIAELEDLLRVVVRGLPLFLAGVFILVLFAITARVTSGYAAKLLTGSTDSELLRSVLRKAIFLAVLTAGIYLALRVTGLTRVAITVVSGTGLLGLALGFAFRDIAENFLASLLLSIQRPFRLDDVIQVDGHTGIVRKVTSRGTLLIDFDGNHIQIANATVYKNTIKNYTANPIMRIDFAIGIGYDDKITHAQQVTRRVLDEHPAILNDPEPLVLVDELGSSTVNLRVYFWINGTEHSMVKVKSSVMRLTFRGLADAGVSMPDEAREVIFPQGVPVQLSTDVDTSERPSQGASASQHQRQTTPKTRARQSGEVAVDAEGDLTTETRDLQRQAARARDPEEGANVLDRLPA